MPGQMWMPEIAPVKFKMPNNPTIHYWSLVCAATKLDESLCLCNDFFKLFDCLACKMSETEITKAHRD